MSELLYYDVMADLNSLGYKDISLDYEILDIEWIEDLYFLLDEESEENEDG